MIPPVTFAERLSGGCPVIRGPVHPTAIDWWWLFGHESEHRDPSAATCCPSAGATKVEKPGVLPSEPLERYFDKGIWARAKAFAMEDATKDASHTLHTRGAAEREAATLKWTALRSKRDRTVERFRYVQLSRRRFGW